VPFAPLVAYWKDSSLSVTTLVTGRRLLHFLGKKK
jgi:hypothetical protein